MNVLETMRGWFTKAPSRLLTSFAWSTGDGVQQNYSLNFGAAYREVPVVKACIDAIAEDAAGVPLKIYRKRGDELVPLDPERDEVARIFSTANPRQSSIAMWTTHYRRLMTWGNAYLLTDYLGRATPQELWSLISGEAMRVIVDKQGQITGYKYRLGPAETTYRPEEIYHARMGADEETDDLYGLSPLTACRLPASLEYATLTHWASVMKNGGMLNAVIRSKGILPKEVKQGIRDEWAENYGSGRGREGYTKSGKIAVFDGDSEYIPVGLSPKEADFIEQSRQVRESVMSVLGVTPARIGVLRSGGLSDANVAEQEALYWQHRILTLHSMTESDLNEVVLPRFGEGYVAQYDHDQVPALQEMLLSRAAKLFTLTGAPVLSRNEAREQLGLPPVVGGDQLFAPTTVTPFGAPRLVADAGGQVGQVIRSKARRAFADTPERRVLREKSGDALDDAARPAISDWTRAIEGQEERMLRGLRSQGKGQKAPEFEELWDAELEFEAARSVATRVLMRTVTSRGQEAIEQVDPTGEFLLNDPAVADFLDEQALRESELIVGRQAQQMRELLATAAREGQTVQEIAAAIRSLYDIERARAQTIARTETSRAYNFATREGWEQSGLVSRREWLAANDEATRDAHAEADGQVVGMDEPFDVGGERLMYPGDPAGSPENTINCRCVELPVVEARSYRVHVGAIPGRNGKIKLTPAGR